MRRAVALLLASLVPLAAGAGRRHRRKEARMELTSPSFKAGAAIPRKFSCEGADVSPALSWTGVPAGTRSLALIVDDPDAPPGTWVHWVLYDIPGETRGLPEGVAKDPQLPDGSRHGASWGVDTFSRAGYSGPCPPPGKAHHYHFKLYALKEKLELKPKATKDELLKAMQGKLLGEAQLIGTFKR